MFDSWQRTRKARRSGGLETWNPQRNWMENARRESHVAAALTETAAGGIAPAAIPEPGTTPAVAIEE